MPGARESDQGYNSYVGSCSVHGTLKRHISSGVDTTFEVTLLYIDEQIDMQASSVRWIDNYDNVNYRLLDEYLLVMMTIMIMLSHLRLIESNIICIKNDVNCDDDTILRTMSSTTTTTEPIWRRMGRMATLFLQVNNSNSAKI